MRSLLQGILKALSALVLLVAYLIATQPVPATVFYLVAAPLLGVDKHIAPRVNSDGENEDGTFLHRFVHVDQTVVGEQANVTYHLVECGDKGAEPVVFVHGLGETWRVWKEVMRPLCATHRPISITCEGFGQSQMGPAHGHLNQSKEFMAEARLALLQKIGATPFNLVVSDYGWWTSMAMTTPEYHHHILRFAKFQSTVGVEDVSRLAQGALIRGAPGAVLSLVNAAPSAFSRIIWGKSTLPLPGLDKQSRRAQVVDDAVYDEFVASELVSSKYDAWLGMYMHSPTMQEHMRAQKEILAAYPFPVSMLQGALDKGQPRFLFDGTAINRVEKKPHSSLLFRVLMPSEYTLQTILSEDGSVIGPTALDFYPSSHWVKLRILENVGHFPHLEAHNETVAAIQELLRVPLAKDYQGEKYRYFDAISV